MTPPIGDLKFNAAVTVVSHNAFWFQGVPYPGAEPGSVNEAVFAQLMEIYQSLSPDLLCLQEVHEQAIAERIGGILNMRCHYTPGCRERVYGGATFWSSRAQVRVRDFRDDASLTPFRSWQRVTWRIPGGTVCLTHLHLPSPRSTGGSDVESVQERELNRFVLQTDFRSDVILGDFNARADAPHVQALRHYGYHDAAALGSFPPGPGLFDQIWLSEAMSRQCFKYRVVNLDAEQYRPRDAHKSRLSDHDPVMVQWMEADDGAI